MSDRNNRRSTTTALRDHHYHHYMTANTSACMTRVPRHGSQEQSRDRLVHQDLTQLNRAHLELCTAAQDPNSNLILHSATMRTHQGRQ